MSLSYKVGCASGDALRLYKDRENLYRTLVERAQKILEFPQEGVCGHPAAGQVCLDR